MLCLQFISVIELLKVGLFENMYMQAVSETLVWNQTTCQQLPKMKSSVLNNKMKIA